MAQESLFRRHVEAKVATARGSDQPTMALTLSRAHLERALATEAELHEGRAWALKTCIPLEALAAAERDDEVPVLLDLPNQRFVAFVGRARHPRFWAAELARREVERRDHELRNLADRTSFGPPTATRADGFPGGTAPRSLERK